jgi:phosphohistidine phosphatase SixA
MKVALLRHAKAVPSSPECEDFDRPLRPKGLRQCGELAATFPHPHALLLSAEVEIWCSPALRTRQTLEYWLSLSAQGSGQGSEPVSAQGLEHVSGQGSEPVQAWDKKAACYFPAWMYLATANRIYSEIMARETDTPLLLIGHNNGLSELAQMLTGDSSLYLGTCHHLVLNAPYSLTEQNLPGTWQSLGRWCPKDDAASI